MTNRNGGLVVKPARAPDADAIYGWSVAILAGKQSLMTMVLIGKGSRMHFRNVTRRGYRALYRMMPPMETDSR